MFKSYEYIDYIANNYGTEEQYWKYKIMDDTFEDISIAHIDNYSIQFRVKRILLTDKQSNSRYIPNLRRSAIEISVAVITTYSKKKDVSIGANLMLAFQWYCKKYGRTTIEEIIGWNKKYNSLYKNYEEEVDKYLLLL